MFVREAGAPARLPVLLVHGHLLDGAFWDPAVPALARTRRVLVPDLPGYGRSPPLPAPWTMERVREELEAALAGRGVEEVDVAGYSAGTYLALALALAGRVRVRRLFLLGAMAGLGREDLAAFGRAAGGGGADVVEAFVAHATPRAWAAAHARELAAVGEAGRRTSPETLAGELEAMSRLTDLRPRLAEVRAETVARCGTEDHNTPLAWSEAIARAVPGARLEVAPGVGHLYLVEDPAATVASLVAFLGADPPTPTPGGGAGGPGTITP